MEDLQNLLCSIKHDVVAYATEGAIDQIHLPRLKINNVGEILLPLCQSQAQKIVNAAKAKSIQTQLIFVQLFNVAT